MWEFNARAMDSFVNWIESREGGRGCAPRDEIPEIRGWLKEDRVRDAEEGLWRVFLYTACGNLSGAKGLRDAVGPWRRPNPDWRRRMRKAFEHDVRCNDHRKYHGFKHTQAAIESYRRLVNAFRSQVQVLRRSQNEKDPFDFLFGAIGGQVKFFGRLAAFDFLVRIEGTGLCPFHIRPRQLYLRGSTGPRHGFEKLCSSPYPGDIEEGGLELYRRLRQRTTGVRDLVDLENALCMWYKSESASH